MSDRLALRHSGRDDLVRHEASRNYEAAQHGGGWMVVVAFALALLWLGGVTASFVGFGGLALLETVSPILIGGGVILAAMPAFLIIMAGYLGRTNRRTTAANALVLEAASRLLAPAREAGVDGITFAEQMKQAADEVDRAMGHALIAMKAMADEVGDERLRLESVTYATSDNARDLGARLAAERQALEGLARDLRSQLNAMNEAIPRQAQLMVAVAREASEEVSRADQALEGRLIAMQQAGSDLSDKLGMLDSLAHDATSRTEALSFSVSRVEDKLDRSRRTVDEAVRASELAAAAAATAGDALNAAVTTALDGARQASAEITAASRSSSEEAVRALARLREAGEQAAYAMRAAGLTARIESDGVDRIEHRLQPPPRPSQIAAPSPLANGHGGNGLSAPSMSRRPAQRQSVEDELFESSADTLATSSLMNAPDDTLELGRTIDPHDNAPLMLRKRFDDGPGRPPVDPPRRRATDLVPSPTENGVADSGPAGWRDILSGMSREEGASPEDREAVADAVVERLTTSGILLGDIFRPKAKRKIAEAAAKGEKQRRNETLSQAGKEVQRVAQRLRGDRRFLELARQFADLEGADALSALEQTQKTSRNASPRLAAFLLVDAAL